MDHKQLYEVRVMNKPRLYNIFKAFNPHSYLGTMGRDDTVEFSKNAKYTDT